MEHNEYYIWNGIDEVPQDVVYVKIKDGVTHIRNEAFYDCKFLKKVDIPDSVTSIGTSAFWGCHNLEKITIPNSVTKIGNYAFRGCEHLEEITISNNVTSIKKGAFYGCYNLKEITIPDSVTSIEDDAFCGCCSLQRVNIPDSVTTIGLGIFCYCSNLEEVRIPNGVTSIDGLTFYDCKNLKRIIVPDDFHTEFPIDYIDNLEIIMDNEFVYGVDYVMYTDHHASNGEIWNGNSATISKIPKIKDEDYNAINIEQISKSKYYSFHYEESLENAINFIREKDSTVHIDFYNVSDEELETIQEEDLNYDCR